MKRGAIVLLSGMDSAAALHWALARYSPVVAFGVDYGQPHRDAELPVAQAIAERRGVPYYGEPALCMKRLDPTAGRDASGVSRAFVPGRNARLVWQAASFAASIWPGGHASIVIGCNADDAAGFPDCRAPFVAQLSSNVQLGMAGAIDIRVDAPWINWLEPAKSMHKAAIVRWAASHPDPAVLEDIRYAVSCYRGTRCSQCDACTVRARAFAEAGVTDGDELPPPMTGGDPSRETRFR